MVKKSVKRKRFRRREEGKTDYRLRKKLITSGKIRMVVRCSLGNTTVQFVSAKLKGDLILTAAHSKELREKYNWRGTCENTPAVYLTGLLAGYKALKRGIKEAILDIGLSFPSRGSRVFAALRGALDAGVKIPYAEEVLPSDARIRGEHIASYASRLLMENSEEYQRSFSKYLARGLKPEKITEHFDEVKKQIAQSFTEDR